MGTRLFIGNLSYNVNEQELREAFTGEGIELRSVRVALDRETGRPRGFAFVETIDGRRREGVHREALGAHAPRARHHRRGGAGQADGTPSRWRGWLWRTASRRLRRAPASTGRRPPGPSGSGWRRRRLRRPAAGWLRRPRVRRPGRGGPPGNFGPPRAPGGFRAGPPGGHAVAALRAPSGDAPRRERPEKKKSTRPKAGGARAGQLALEREDRRRLGARGASEGPPRAPRRV